MGRHRFLALLLISALVFLSFSQGNGRRIRVMKHYGRWRLPVPAENSVMEREMMEMMDYQQEPGPNTNPKAGTLFNPPGPPPAL